MNTNPTLRSNGWRSGKMTMQYALLVLPAFVIFTVGVIVPLVLGFFDSLTNWNGLSPDKMYVGLDNYRQMLNDPYVGASWGFTVQFTVLNTVIQNVCAILLAVALDSGIHGKKLLRTVFFIPCLISAVIVGFIWLKMYGNVLPALFDALGIKINVMLFGNGNTVLSGLLIWLIILRCSKLLIPIMPTHCWQTIPKVSSCWGRSSFAPPELKRFIPI